MSTFPTGSARRMLRAPTIALSITFITVASTRFVWKPTRAFRAWPTWVAGPITYAGGSCREG